MLSLLGLISSLSCDGDVSDDLTTSSQQAGLTLGPVNVLTRNYDNGRSGANMQETVLNTSTVNAANFGKRFSVAVDNPVFAGILYASQVPMAGGNKNVFYVATMNNTVYAFDANVGGSPLWQKNFNGASQPTKTNQVGSGGPFFFCPTYTDISGNGPVANIGIVGTPVIDGASGKYYVVTRTGSGTPGTVMALHALDLLTGNETAGSPVTLSGAGYSAELNNQRPALALANGQVYISFSSFCDAGAFHGIVLGYAVNNLGAAPQVYNVTPSGTQGGIWMGGAGPVVDASGSVYVATGNGTSDTTNLSEALVKLSPSSLSTVQDWFMPSNFASLNSSDTDLGSGGPTLLPGVANRIVQGSKEGKVYLLDTTNLGHVRTDAANLQTLNAVVISNGGSTKHIHNASVAWQSQAGLGLYVWGENDALRLYRWNGSTFNTTPFAVGSKVLPKGMPGGMMTLSSSGSTPGTGILWGYTPAPTSGTDSGQNDANHNLVPGILRAFNAESLALLWESSSANDNTGTFAKFNPPTVANGRVYVPSFSNVVSVYGLVQPSTPFVTVNLPGTIEAENYDNGGEGVAYHDVDVANQGNAATPPNTYRTTESVDLQPTGDTGGGFNLGWTAVGEWLKYTVNITQAGLYTLTGRYASMAGAGSFRVEVDGADVTGTIQPTTTNSWTTWNTFTKANVNLPAGQHVLRLFEITAGFNLNNLTFTLNAPMCTTVADCNDNNPCTVDACSSGSCTHVAGNAGTVCRAAAGACDQAESCTGSSTTCPADTFLPAATVCRAAAGVCDQAESCTGSSAACPNDGFLSAATVCRAAVDLCDQAETCTGTGTACPADAIKPSGAVCRAAAGTCDTAETCNGSSTACPADTILPAGTTCRASAGACDVAETCTGSSGVCPADTFVAGGTVCRASAGVCDVAEACTGSSGVCPNDAFLGASTVCRAAVDLCDQAESCTGAAAACPADGLKPAGTVCRTAANQCDAAETCNGSVAACPADGLAPNGTSCNDGNSGTCSDVCTAGVCGGTTCSSQAFGGTPRSITSTIQAEDYDIGGEGAGYHDTTAGNQGGQYRTDNVDIEATTDTNGGFNVGFVAAGEWMNYSVTVATGGSYKVSLRVASMSAAQTMHVEVDGVNVTGAITVPNTTGWQTWQTVTQTLKAYFSAGNHVVRVMFDTLAATNGGINLNWLTFVANPGPFGGTVRSMTSTIQAEDFDLGGEAIGYHDNEAANQGTKYRTTEGVDIESTTDTGGGFNVGWTNAGEWMAYTVSNAATITAVNVRVAATAAQTMHIEVDGVNVSGTINVPNTTGWQTWQTVTKTLTTTVPAGTHIMRVVFDSSGPNLNWVSFN